MEDKIGGDADLSSRGQMYAARLPDLIKEHVGDRPLTVWTSSMKRTIQTASQLPYPKKSWKALDELNTGVCDGMTYAEIEVCKGVQNNDRHILTSIHIGKVSRRLCTS